MKHGMVLLVYICFFFLALFCVIAGLQYYVNTVQESTRTETDTYLKEISALCAQIIENQIKLDMNFLESNAGFFSRLDSPKQEDIGIFFEDVGNYSSFKRVGLIFPDGTAYTSDNHKVDLNHREFFHRALGGDSNISDVLIDVMGGSQIVVFAVPVKKDGVVVSVFFGTKDTEAYSRQVGINPLSGAGKCILIKTTGEIITVPPDSYLPENKPLSKNILDNLHQFGVSDAEYEKFVTDITNRLGGLITYTWQNDMIRLAYAPVPQQNWMLLISFEDAIVGRAGTVVISRTTNIVIFCVIVLLFTFLSLSLRDYMNQKQIKRIAFTDKVTGFANWEKFKIKAGRLLESSRNNYAVFTFETDDFRLYNDIYGRKSADDLLCFIAVFLHRFCAHGEDFCRYSADNFIVLVKDEGTEKLENRLENLVSFLRNLNESSFISFRFGVYRINDRSQTINECCDKAYIAKLIAKASFDKQVAYYDKTIHKKIIEEKRYEEIMEESLQKGEFIMFLQPKIEISTLRVTGAEALVRWRHPEKGLVAPSQFLPLFEKNGFITQIDFEICRQACCQIRKWIDSGVQPIPISVNFSRLHLQTKDFIQHVNVIVDSFQIPHKYIEIEITETIAEHLQNDKALKSIIVNFQDAGYEVSMDDFGSGYSSLNMLAKLPVNSLKMDKRFFDDVALNANSSVLSIISGVIAIAKDLNMKVVAEGIECRQQYDMLKSMNCDTIQGFYFAPPLQIAEFEQYVHLCNRETGI